MHINLSTIGEQNAGKALIDPGAAGNFADQRWIKKKKITTRKVSALIPNNADGTTNQGGVILEAADIELGISGFPGKETLLITTLGKEDVILGMLWLKKHNPEIDWRTQHIKPTINELTDEPTIKTLNPMFGNRNSIVLSEAEFQKIELNTVKAVEFAQKVKANEQRRSLGEMVPNEILDRYRKGFEKESSERLPEHKA